MKEFNLSNEGIGSEMDDNFEFTQHHYAEKDVKEFIRRDTRIILDFVAGTINLEELIKQRKELAGKELSECKKLAQNAPQEESQ